jgi:hypothetical protein
MTKPGGKSPTNQRGKYLDGMNGPAQFRNSDAVIAAGLRLVDAPDRPLNRQERRTKAKLKRRTR